MRSLVLRVGKLTPGGLTAGWWGLSDTLLLPLGKKDWRNPHRWAVPEVMKGERR